MQLSSQGREWVMIILLTICYFNCSQENNDQLDCRYFGELLAELNRKTNDLYSCLLQHVEKIGGRYWPYVCHLTFWYSRNPRSAQLGAQIQVDWVLTMSLFFPHNQRYFGTPLSLSLGAFKVHWNECNCSVAWEEWDLNITKNPSTAKKTPDACQ